MAGCLAERPASPHAAIVSRFSLVNGQGREGVRTGTSDLHRVDGNVDWQTKLRGKNRSLVVDSVSLFT